MRLLLATFFIISSSLFFIECARLKNCKGWPAFKKKLVSDCEAKDEICPFKRGTNVTFAASFIATNNTNNVTFQVWGKVEGTAVKVPFPIEPNDACHWGVKCPVKKGEKYDFNVAVFVEKVFPRTNVNVGMEILSNNKTRTACVIIPVKIT